MRLAVLVDSSEIPHPDGYRLSIREDGITLAGASSAGCFHGWQTLLQLRRSHDRAIPCCEILDWPDFGLRGLLHDVTRGKVPTLATLKALADRLVTIKINQLQLYIEHAFTFAFDPDIAGGDEAITPDEIRELDAYCRERFIELVPAVATLGHMGRILSMPRYRHLAEIEPALEWAELSWPQRARGFTLDVANPEAHRLVERIWSEILDAFSSPVVNLCGDEPWDLGKGKDKERFASCGVGEAYIDHILRTHAICAARGRRAQVWSDVVKNHPELFHRLPGDLTVLHWGYDDRADYEGTRRFTDAGLDTVVCPGTTGWKRILNAMNLAERNIATFAEAGKKHGAVGLLNTDWGDHGHFNALACSWHGIGLGAALGWRADHPTGLEFDRCFVRSFLERAPHDDPSRAWEGAGKREGTEAQRHEGTKGDLRSSRAQESNGVLSQQGAGVDWPLSDLITLLREASRIADGCETWRLFWQPIAQIKDDPTLPSVDEAACAADAARRAAALLRGVESAAFADPNDRHELLVACAFTELFADRVRLIRAAGLKTAGPASPDAARFRDRLSAATASFAECWRARNKPSGFDDILATLEKVGRDAAG